MAEQEITADLDAMLDMPAPGRSRTARAVALAQLLHKECDQLLQLYVSTSRPAHVTFLSPGLIMIN